MNNSSCLDIRTKGDSAFIHLYPFKKLLTEIKGWYSDKKNNGNAYANEIANAVEQRSRFQFSINPEFLATKYTSQSVQDPTEGKNNLSLL